MRGSMFPAVSVLSLGQAALACLLVLLGCSAGAATATILGRVAFQPAAPPPVPPRYRVRTLAPILEPDPQRAVVYLERTEGAYPLPDDRDRLVIAQRGYQFRPAVAAVRVGARVSFPNEDREFHNVFSYSSAKRFDLGRYRPDEPSPRVTFDEPGLIKIYCEIHRHMRSLLLVLETPWFTATAPDGTYELTGVPPGRYRLKAFLPTEDILDVPVAVGEGERVVVDLPANP